MTDNYDFEKSSRFQDIDECSPFTENNTKDSIMTLIKVHVPIPLYLLSNSIEVKLKIYRNLPGLIII